MNSTASGLFGSVLVDLTHRYSAGTHLAGTSRFCFLAVLPALAVALGVFACRELHGRECRARRMVLRRWQERLGRAGLKLAEGSGQLAQPAHAADGHGHIVKVGDIAPVTPSDRRGEAAEAPLGLLVTLVLAAAARPRLPPLLPRGMPGEGISPGEGILAVSACAWRAW